MSSAIVIDALAALRSSCNVPARSAHAAARAPSLRHARSDTKREVVSINRRARPGRRYQHENGDVVPRRAGAPLLRRWPEASWRCPCRGAPGPARRRWPIVGTANLVAHQPSHQRGLTRRRQIHHHFGNTWHEELPFPVTVDASRVPSPRTGFRNRWCKLFRMILINDRYSAPRRCPSATGRTMGPRTIRHRMTRANYERRSSEWRFAPGVCREITLSKPGNGRP